MWDVKHIKRYRKLRVICAECVNEMLVAPANPETLTGQTKRRATFNAKRLMRASRDLWRLLSIEAKR